MKKLNIHPQNPQARLIQQAVDVLKQDQLIIYPTELGYQFGLTLNAKSALQQLKQLEQQCENFTLLCRDLSEVATYANINNWQYRLLKKHTPSSFHFILDATKETPKKFLHPKTKTITIKVSDNPITLALLESLNTPLLSYQLIFPDNKFYDAEEIENIFGKQVGALLDVGIITSHTATIIDITDIEPALVQQGSYMPWD